MNEQKRYKFINVSVLIVNNIFISSFVSPKMYTQTVCVHSTVGAFILEKVHLPQEWLVSSS